jgi:hypothetical protein
MEGDENYTPFWYGVQIRTSIPGSPLPLTSPFWYGVQIRTSIPGSLLPLTSSSGILGHMPSCSFN